MSGHEPQSRQGTHQDQPSRRAELRAREQRRRRFRWSLAVATVLIVVVVAGLVASQATTSKSTIPGITTPQALSPANTLLPIGSKAPDFNLATLDGHRYTLST